MKAKGRAAEDRLFLCALLALCLGLGPRGLYAAFVLLAFITCVFLAASVFRFLLVIRQRCVRRRC